MNRSVSQLNLQQPEKDRCFEDRNTLTPQEMKVLSFELAEDQLGVILASLAWVNTTDSAVRPVEAEVQTWRATTICVIRASEPLGLRKCNAWTNDFRTLAVCCNVL